MSVEAMKQALEALESAANNECNFHDYKNAAITLRQAIKDEEEAFRPDYDTNAVLLERIRELEAQLERQQAEKQDADQWYEKALWGEKQEALTGLAETSREIEQEPVAWVANTEQELTPEFAFSWVKASMHDTPLYTATLSIKPENIDTKSAHVDSVDIEPVAWMHVQGDYQEPNSYELDDEFLMRGWEQYPLYAAPPKREWQSLTDNEIIWIENSTPSRSYNDHARAIEAKLKELNHD